MNARPHPIGDADLAAVGALLAEPARAKVLLALADGRSLAASVLAIEAGVARRVRKLVRGFPERPAR